MTKEKRYCKFCKNEIIQNIGDKIVWIHRRTNDPSCDYDGKKPFSLTTPVAEPYVDPKKLKIFNKEDLLGLFDD